MVGLCLAWAFGPWVLRPCTGRPLLAQLGTATAPEGAGSLGPALPSLVSSFLPSRKLSLCLLSKSCPFPAAPLPLNASRNVPSPSCST